MFIQLTEDNNSIIYLNVLQINKIISKDTGSIIFTALGTITVKEHPDTILQQIEYLIKNTVTNILIDWRQING